MSSVCRSSAARRRPTVAAGRRMVNVEPRPGSDQTPTSPPWLAVTCLTMDRPRPVPPVAAGPGGVDAVEPLEDPRLLRGGDALPLVGDRQLHLLVAIAVDGPHPHRDPGVRLGVGDGVADEVAHRRDQQLVVAPHRAVPGADDADGDALVLGGDAATGRPPRGPRATRSTWWGSVRDAATWRRERSTISCTRRVSRVDSTCIRRAKRATASGSSWASSTASASRARPPTGVFSSWETLATKSRRISSSRRAWLRSSTRSRTWAEPSGATRATDDEPGPAGRALRQLELDLADDAVTAHLPGQRRGARAARGRCRAPGRWRPPPVSC